ncbi:MAG TPA: hypothetical protein VHP62_09470 [Usitatibacter sp.]|nr:hypothetical protein [Usitatibacter sp.]
MKTRGLSPWSKRCLHRYAMPPQVRHRILEAVARGDRSRLRSVMSRVLDSVKTRWAPIGMGFAAGALVGAMALDGSIDLAQGEPMGHEVISSHVRSLLADHLSDVASADGETVRSWFNGRLDYAPRVSDLSSQGYALVGGRLDYVGGRAVAALVYRHANHFVNVFSCPLAGRRGEERGIERRGFNAVGWSDATMQYWVVADLDGGELKRLAAQLRRE